MKIRKSRAVSLFIITAIYAVAITIGVLVYNALSFDRWINVLIADVVATVFTFIFSMILGNSSVYDPYWSVQPMVIVLFVALTEELSFAHWLIIICVCLWGVRLTANWAYTFKNLDWQDWRYVMLKQKTGIFYPLINFLGIHLFPTLVVYLCVMPIVIALSYTTPVSVMTIVGVVVSASAFTLQGVADVQMHAYRKQRKTPFIRTGLWKYSRHPNYLGEILMWWGVCIACYSLVADKWYLFIGALVNTLMFLFVSIPLADGRQSQKAGFEEYKKQTRILLPIKK